MLYTHRRILPIDIGLEHRKKAIFAAASEVMKALAPFLALDITVQLHIYE